MTRRRVAAGGALVLLAAVTAGAVRARPAVAVAPAGPPASTSPGVGSGPSGTTMTLVSQTTWVTPGAPFNLAIDVHTTEPADQVLVSVDLYTALGSRSEFARSLTAGWSGYVLSRPVRNVPLDTMHTDASGTVHISLPTGHLINQLHVTTPGVYPVAVTLRTRGIESPIARFMTDLVSTPAAASDKLNVVWVVPVHAPPTDPSASTAALPGAATASLNALVDALAAHPKVPLTLDATPDTLASLMVGDGLTVSRLGQSLAGREVLASTWVPTPIPSMLADGLGTEAVSYTHLTLPTTPYV